MMMSVSEAEDGAEPEKGSMEKWRDLLAGRTPQPSGCIANGGCWLLPGRAAEHLHLTSSLSLESHQLKVLGVKRESVRWEGY